MNATDTDYFTEVWTVVNGAMDEEWTVEGPDQFDAIVATIDQWWTQDRWLSGMLYSEVPTVELFALNHGHSPECGECECVQFLQDHRPLVVWNAEYGKTVTS